MLSFFNERGLLRDVSLTRSQNIRDIALSGRLGFADYWGHPLIVADATAKTVSVYMEGKTTVIAVPKIDKDLAVLIWSVGPDGIDQSGRGDDLSNWRY